MNQKQMDHAVKRAGAILANRKLALESAFLIPAVKLDRAEKLAALRNGDFTADPPEDPYDRSYWHSWVRFTAERPVSHKPGYEEALKSLTDQHARLVDQLMLGSTAEALALLDAFSVHEVAA